LNDQTGKRLPSNDHVNDRSDFGTRQTTNKISAMSGLDAEKDFFTTIVVPPSWLVYRDHWKNGHGLRVGMLPFHAARVHRLTPPAAPRPALFTKLLSPPWSKFTEASFCHLGLFIGLVGPCHDASIMARVQLLPRGCCRRQ
jgi:hypothetical protein